MERRDRLRRVVVLCHNFLQSHEYYMAAEALQFTDMGTAAYAYASTHHNLNACVLGWCKLFADKGGMHTWKNVVSDSASFERGLLAYLPTNATELETYRVEMRVYRDQYVAHLDDGETYRTPFLDMAEKSVVYYFEHIASKEADPNDLQDLPGSADAMRSLCRKWRSQATEAIGRLLAD
jgi:hypothetical protein